MYSAWLISKRGGKPRGDSLTESTPLLVPPLGRHSSSWFHDVVDVDTVDLTIDEYTEEEGDEGSAPNKSLFRSLYHFLA